MKTLTHLSPATSQRWLADEMLLHHVPVQRTSWQGEDAPAPAHELSNVVLEFPVPDSLQQWQDTCQPDLPWAEEHFLERVSGKGMNPTPSYVRWPWHSREQAEKFIREGGRFDHTYPERYWPRSQPHRPIDEVYYDYQGDFGDLQDVVKLLRRDTWTRQAFLPVWFPEDTGAVNGQRVPCTLGYHFLRNGPQLDCNYFIRSCDLTRHYKNDIYLTGRLLQYMVEQVQKKDGTPWSGTLTIFISNLHLFTSDAWRYQ